MKKAKPHSAAVDDFAAHLKAKGLAPNTVHHYGLTVQRFLTFVGNEPIDRINEERVRMFFQDIKNPIAKRNLATVISQFLHYAAAKLPVVLNKAGGAIPPPVRKPTKKQIALREKWTLDKLKAECESKDKLIAQLARQLVAHYVHFQKQLKGEPADLDEVSRLADECRELIQSNLMLFMGLSAEGHNINPKFSERILPS